MSELQLTKHQPFPIKYESPREGGIEGLLFGEEVDNFFARRKEIGINVYFLKDKDNYNFHYFKSQRPNSPTHVSQNYALDAMCALVKYDQIIEKSRNSQALTMEEVYQEWDELRKAKQLADQYFTQEARQQAHKNINKLLDKKVTVVAPYAKSTSADPAFAKEVFSRLIESKNPDNLSDAYTISKKHLSPTIANFTKHHLRKVVMDNSEAYGKAFPTPLDYTKRGRPKKHSFNTPTTIIRLPQTKKIEKVNTPPPLPQAYLAKCQARKLGLIPPKLPQAHLKKVRARKKECQSLNERVDNILKECDAILSEHQKNTPPPLPKPQKRFPIYEQICRELGPLKSYCLKNPCFISIAFP